MLNDHEEILQHLVRCWNVDFFDIDDDSGLDAQESTLVPPPAFDYSQRPNAEDYDWNF